MARSVVVIGGGVAGLEAARQLAIGGDRVLLLEAGTCTGGAVRAESIGGVRVDVGAEAFAITRPETRALIDELGLSADVVAPRRWDAHLLLPEGLHDMPHAMLGVPTDLASAEVEAIIGADEVRRAQQRDAQPLGIIDPPCTVGELVRDRMGDVVADRILTPVVAGVHAADPDLVEAEAVIPGLIAALQETGSLAAAAQRLRGGAGKPGSAIAGLRGGMTTLVRALDADAQRRGVEVRVNSPVLSVHRTVGGWQVESAAGNFDADAVVLAIDAPAAARLLGDAAAVRSTLQRIAVGDVVVCAAVIDAPELDADPVGSGVLVAPGHASVQAKALTHASAKWAWIRESFPGRHLVRLSYGRDGRVDERVEDLPSIVRADIAAIFDIAEPELLGFHTARWDRSLVLARSGHTATLAALRKAVEAEPALAVVGAGIGGNGLAGTIALSRSVRAQLDRSASDPIAMGD